jgi:hypothetical protein
MPDSIATTTSGRALIPGDHSAKPNVCSAGLAPRSAVMTRASVPNVGYIERGHEDEQEESDGNQGDRRREDRHDADL